MVYRGYGDIGVNPFPCPVEVAIAVIGWGRYLGPEALEQGVDVKISTWGRMAPNTFPALAKAGANYMNSQLIKMEAVVDGYVEGIALDNQGYVLRGERGERLRCPRRSDHGRPRSAPASCRGSPGTTVIRLARDLDIPLEEALVPREALYVADEVFFTGTAAEITPIRSVDKVKIGSGSRGPVAEALQNEFFGILSGEKPDPSWLADSRERMKHWWTHESLPRTRPIRMRGLPISARSTSPNIGGIRSLGQSFQLKRRRSEGS